MLKILFINLVLIFMSEKQINEETLSPCCEVEYEVYLRKYDLAHNLNKNYISEMFKINVLDGIWHTSIEIYDTEYFFGHGIKSCIPGKCNSYGKYVSRELIGKTRCNPDLFKELLNEWSKEEWAPHTYHLLNHNCNHFSDYLSKFLLGKGIPADILKQAEDAKNSNISQLLEANINIFNEFINGPKK